MKIVKKIDTFVESMCGEDAVLLHLETGRFHTLRGVSLQVWRAIDNKKDVDHIVAELAYRYDVTSDVCERDVSSFVAELQAAGFLQN